VKGNQENRGEVIQVLGGESGTQMVRTSGGSKSNREERKKEVQKDWMDRKN